MEDDPFLLSMYSTKFELEDFQVISANDGQKGLDFALKEKPDIILLDILLPKMNGLEVLEKINENLKE